MDHLGPRPLYEQIADTIVADLERHYKPGDRIPPEDELTARFRVHRHTLRHAIDLLVADGRVERRRGIGTFVLDRPLEYPLTSSTRFTATVEGLGHPSDTELLRKATVPVESAVAERLGISVGETVFRFDTRRSVDGRVMTVITHWLACDQLPDLGRHYVGGSLHACIELHYGFQLRRATTLVAAVPAHDEDASQLMIPRGMPLLRLRTINVHADTGRPCEFAIARSRADRLELHIDHENRS